MLARRTFVFGLPLAAALVVVTSTNSAPAVDPPAIGSGGLPKGFDLKKQLETGLKARRPVDFSYIEEIVAKVESGTLPRKLVDQAYFYARAKSNDRPIVYFQFSLKKLTEKAGVKL